MFYNVLIVIQPAKWMLEHRDHEGGVELLRGPRQSGFGKLGDGVVERGCGHWLGEGHGPEQREARRRRRRLARRPEREDERQQTHDLSV